MPISRKQFALNSKLMNGCKNREPYLVHVVTLPSDAD
jgi:hypothetical protein